MRAEAHRRTAGNERKRDAVKVSQKLIEIPVMHCFDDNYVIPAAVSFSSMLSHANPQYAYRLYVLHSDITVHHQKKLAGLVEKYPNASLTFINMNNRLHDVWASCGTDHGHLRKEVFYKLLAPSLFPQYQKIIITDVDVVFSGDIAPSYFVLDEYPEAYYAGVRQINPKGTFLRDYYNNTYKKQMDSEEFAQLKICGGYLVANLERLRRDGMEEAMVDCLRKNIATLWQLEQDVINYCCRDKQIVYLPLNYVVCSYMYDLCREPSVCASDPHYTYREMRDAMEHPIQLHYATGSKPWNDPEITKAELWYQQLKRTSFQEDYGRLAQARAAKEDLPDCPCMDLRSKPGRTFPKKVSVLCCTYNHERFIEAALEGILGQNTNFDFEVIVADDASTDRTQEIITRFQKKYPARMSKTILRQKNVGIGENYYDALTKAEGEYLAVCDGDDCWTDSGKLQMQVDFLEKNPDCAVVCTDFVSHYVDDRDREDSVFKVVQYAGRTKQHYTLRDLIFSRFIASCTLMMRWQLHGRVPDFLRAYRVIDFPLEMIHASMGYIGVIEQCTARYNVHRSSVSSDGGRLLMNQTVTLVREVNQYFDYRLTILQDEYLACVQAEQESAQAVQDSAAGGPRAPREKFSVRIAKLLYHIYWDILPVSMRGFVKKVAPKKIYHWLRELLRG